MVIVMDAANAEQIKERQNYSYYDSKIVLPHVGRLPSMNNNRDSGSLSNRSVVSSYESAEPHSATPRQTSESSHEFENGMRQGQYGPQQTLLEHIDTLPKELVEDIDREQQLFVPQPPVQPKTKTSRTSRNVVRPSDSDSDKAINRYEVPVVADFHNSSSNSSKGDENENKYEKKQKGKGKSNMLSNDKELISMYKDFLNQKFGNDLKSEEDSSADESEFSISSLSGNESDDEFGGSKTLTSTNFEPLYSLPNKEKNRKLERPKVEHKFLLDKIVLSKSNANLSDDNILNALKTGSLPDLRSLDKVKIQRVTHVAKNESEAESEPGAKLTYKFRLLPPIPDTSSNLSSGLYETIDGLSKQKLVSESPEKKENKRTFKDIAKFLTLIPKLTTNSVRSRKQDHKLADITHYLPDKKLKIFIGTWNMKGTKSLPDSLDDFLLPPESVYLQDIYVIGTQEGTPFRREWQVRLQETFGPSHVLMQASNFGVLQLSIFVRRELVWFCSGVEQDTIATRMGHKIKTKGALAMSFNMFGTSFLFITSHFTSHEGKLRDRINDYRAICENIQLPYAEPNKGNEKDVTTRFDRVFWFGDFNFRVKKPRDVVDNMLVKYHKNEELLIKELLHHDQLNDIFQKGKIFHGFTEAPITFMPTYKFDVNTNRYDTSSKQRVPSWTDRIVHKSVPVHHLQAICYNSCNTIKVSDHRPVYGIFEATLEPYQSSFTGGGATFDRDVYVEANLRRVAPSGTQGNSHVCTIL